VAVECGDEDEKREEGKEEPCGKGGGAPYHCEGPASAAFVKRRGKSAAFRSLARPLLHWGERP
jgi:hypothetical protein